MSAAVRTAIPVWRSTSRSSEQTRILREVLGAVKALPGSLVTFDLDSTLFDNRPRQLRILSEFAEAHGLTGHEGLEPEEIDAWRVADVLPLLTGAKGREGELRRLWKPFWRERFFTSAYCRFDAPLPGAADYVRSMEMAGGGVVYVTGRHEAMREGTAGALAEHRFPEGRLLVKPDLSIGDTDWKEQSVARLKAMGPVAACFDNETTHVNAFRRAFPEARVIWVRTDHSLEAEPLPEDVPAVDGFLL